MNTIPMISLLCDPLTGVFPVKTGFQSNPMDVDYAFEHVMSVVTSYNEEWMMFVQNCAIRKRGEDLECKESEPLSRVWNMPRVCC